MTVSSIGAAGNAATRAAAVPPPPPPPYSRLDEADVAQARALGLLRGDLAVSGDAAAPDFGVVYEKRGGSKREGVCSDAFPSQRALQERCKQLAMLRGFQLVVAGSSVRADGGGNVKYRCKKLHGQQFLDPSTPVAELQCPFYVNGFGKGSAWKITRACLLHNHYKFIGGRPSAAAATTGPAAGDVTGATPAVGGDGTQLPASGAAVITSSGGDAGASLKDKATRLPMQRNTTLSTKSLCQIVVDEVNKFPAPWLVMARLDGKMIKRIMLSRGHTINHMMASRIKRQLHESRVSAIRASFQKLTSYLRVVAEKNPGSLFEVEKTELGVFKRALFIPSATLHAFKYCHKIVSLDHMVPAWHEADAPLGGGSGKSSANENDDALCGMFLTAMSKDANDQVVTLALALVAEENQESWEWFLGAVRMGSGVNLAEYTVIAGRSRGLQQALQNVWPSASHHLCVRRLVEEEMVLDRKMPVTQDKKRRIFDLARSESEAEYTKQRDALFQTNASAVGFLDALDRASWVKYAFLEAFRKPTFNEISSDLATLTGDEDLFAATPTQISWFGEDPVRSSQPLQTFNLYFVRLADNFHQRRASVKDRAPQELVPRRQAQMETILQGSQRCEVRPAGSSCMYRSEL